MSSPPISSMGSLGWKMPSWMSFSYSSRVQRRVLISYSAMAPSVSGGGAGVNVTRWRHPQMKIPTRVTPVSGSMCSRSFRLLRPNVNLPEHISGNKTQRDENDAEPNGAVEEEDQDECHVIAQVEVCPA